MENITEKPTWSNEEMTNHEEPSPNIYIYIRGPASVTQEHYGKKKTKKIKSQSSRKSAVKCLC